MAVRRQVRLPAIFQIILKRENLPYVRFRKETPTHRPFRTSFDRQLRTVDATGRFERNHGATAGLE